MHAQHDQNPHDPVYFLRRSLDGALDNAHDMGVHDLARCVDHAIASVVYDILVGDPDGYPEGGYLEHYDDNDKRVDFTRRELLAVLPEALEKWMRTVYK